MTWETLWENHWGLNDMKNLMVDLEALILWVIIFWSWLEGVGVAVRCRAVAFPNEEKEPWDPQILGIL